jgi:exodeoxyribonuclease-3
MKFLSWNVNGLRAVMKKGFLDFFNSENPDFLCLQETRVLPGQIKLDLAGYESFWNPAEKKGYSGTLILTRHKPLSESYGIGKAEHDNEGRVITLEYSDYFLVTVYTPNAGRDLERLEYRVMWDREFLKYLRKLHQKKPLIFCGDLNVAHQEIDLANPKSNEQNAGFTREERSGMENIIQAGFLDTFREFEKGGGHYTWWSYMFQARFRNVGWRIDYFCLSPELRNRLKNAYILKDVLGSDHCPVAMILD